MICFFSNLDEYKDFTKRNFGIDIDCERLEKKIKRNGFTLKEQAVLSREECEDLILGRSADAGKTGDNIKSGLLSQMAAGGMRPVIIISYERLPFIYPGSDIRFTIDTRIRFSTDVKSFLNPDKKAMMSLGGGFSVVELKWGRYLPEHIPEYLAVNSLARTRFSKYYYCRSMALNGH